MAWLEVDVELDEFSDDEIEAEYKSRKLGNTAPDEQHQRAYTLYHQGKKDEAYAILWDVCLDKLNKVI
jgi:hypothetical protein